MQDTPELTAAAENNPEQQQELVTAAGVVGRFGGVAAGALALAAPTFAGIGTRVVMQSAAMASRAALSGSSIERLQRVFVAT